MITSRLKVKQDKFSPTVRALSAMSKEVEVGYPKNTTGSEQPYENDITLAENAVFQEYGTKNIPPRPFMRKGAKSFKGDSAKIKAILAAALETGNTSTGFSLGELLKTHIANALKEGDFTPLAPSTVQRKGHDTPLQETGALLSGLDVVVK